MKADPQHVAIIMDGNGRWAQGRGKNRVWGHVKGSEVAQKIVEHCAAKTSIKYLTLYAFSTENWSRPEEEVRFLFKLLEHHINKKQKYMIENGVKLSVIGDLSKLPNSLQSNIRSVVEKTQNNTGLHLSLALNYGGRQDIITTFNTYLEGNTAALDEKTFSKLMSKDGTPEPDLVIRTSGEQRLSNFMLWQTAYSELYFTKTLWPDFTFQDFDDAISYYTKRDRRYGSLEHSSEMARPL